MRILDNVLRRTEVFKKTGTGACKRYLRNTSVNLHGKFRHSLDALSWFLEWFFDGGAIYQVVTNGFLHEYNKMLCTINTRNSILDFLISSFSENNFWLNERYEKEFSEVMQAPDLLNFILQITNRFD